MFRQAVTVRLPTPSGCDPHIHRPHLQVLCAEMAESFAVRGLTLPPWRRTQSMLSKWIPAKSHDIDFGRHSSPEPAAKTAEGISPTSVMMVSSRQLSSRDVLTTSSSSSSSAAALQRVSGHGGFLRGNSGDCSAGGAGALGGGGQQRSMIPSSPSASPPPLRQLFVTSPPTATAVVGFDLRTSTSGSLNCEV